MRIKTAIVFLSIVYGFYGCDTPLKNQNKEGLNSNPRHEQSSNSMNKSAPEKSNKISADKPTEIEDSSPEELSIESVAIGNQIWMAENLNTERFQNGNMINQAKNFDEWMKACYNKQSAWCYYNFDQANGTKYGKLYNGYAVKDSRGLAPSGWHVAADEEWIALINFLGEESAKKVKSVSEWQSDGNGNNATGFSALPGGYLTGDYEKNTCEFSALGHYSNWWTSTEFASENVIRYRQLSSFSPDIRKNGGMVSLKTNPVGYYVRCVKD
jgi:uncharacterized protein (TIGR02145 family)